MGNLIRQDIGEKTGALLILLVALTWRPHRLSPASSEILTRQFWTLAAQSAGSLPTGASFASAKAWMPLGRFKT